MSSKTQLYTQCPRSSFTEIIFIYFRLDLMTKNRNYMQETVMKSNSYLYIHMSRQCQAAIWQISDQIWRQTKRLESKSQWASVAEKDGRNSIFHLIINGWQIFFNAFMHRSGDTLSGSNYCITHDLIVKDETSIIEAEISGEGGEGAHFLNDRIWDFHVC